MASRCNLYGIQLYCSFVLILVLETHGHCLPNSEVLALLGFRDSVKSDPHGVFSNWDPNDCNPCKWSGVRCVNNLVQMLDLKGLSLEGVLAPDLGKLANLKILILSQNQFYGTIPREFGGLAMLEVLDLRNNTLNGTIPVELKGIHSLKHLLLYNNNFKESTFLQHGKVDLLSKSQYGNRVSKASVGIGCINRKIGPCISHGGLESLKKSESFLPTTRTLKYHLNMLLPMFKFEEGSSCSNADDGCDTPSAGSSEQQILNLNDVVRRRLAEQSSNLAAAPARDASPAVQIIALPSSRSSGSFPAVPKEKRKHSLPPAPSPAEPPINEFHMNKTNESGKTSKETSGLSGNTWIFIIGILSAVLVLVVALALFFICRTHAVAGTSDSWKMGLTGQLQKAFVTGVPKLNRAELVTACEDFSNIIETHNYFTVYKGTLSSGVEVAVFSTTINSLKDWSAHSEQVYRKKIEVLSRVNHKNFVNLIGHCEEDEPFTRMMVLEYAPNGSLSEHLHIMELDHLDWTTRIRIIMGTAYCLQYMHELNPPLPHSNLNANAVLLTEDYAAKIVEVDFWKDILYKSEVSVDNKSEHSKLGPLADTEENVYCFGVLLLEIISGKFPYSEEHGPLVDWAASYLKDKRSYLVDPTLKTFENDQLDIICEVIQDCIQQDARKRPTIKEIVSKLRQVINVSPEAAVPRQSPLWWAELEISSAETS
ncbi:protein MALE DISCOVERER 2 isoform X1 [Daucus carota subsp. sativus]|uniref:protein MALE DISCOVERER 2 isoform X1 n=1 Tax=Daucus carota subsp. sativus TaxID=79200 RepID=UPI0007F0012B|nr:PREDICTED: protein MALE DISCOVERER 2-like isoform X1 [Daucus carota subsp. sativus]XP_017236397.1 PREDICTED: protein MALE DISCOVERER 2-like isoform X1 [Daucus carota subsp. sativus]